MELDAPSPKMLQSLGTGLQGQLHPTRENDGLGIVVEELLHARHRDAGHLVGSGLPSVPRPAAAGQSFRNGYAALRRTTPRPRRPKPSSASVPGSGTLEITSVTPVPGVYEPRPVNGSGQRL